MSSLRLRLNGRIWRCICVFMFLLILVDGLFMDSQNRLLVNTKWGLFHGKLSRTIRDRTVANFLGIPYALPPVGDLRFRSPQRWNHTWTKIRNATNDGPKCIQTDMKTSKVIGSEDCLYLNIFIPYISDNQQKGTKLPVLVFVHGGFYMIGSSDSNLYAPDYLLEQNIILVTLNYRLSVLGFFSTTNEVAPGNYGLKDIKMALEWIQENIHSFEGNPESVTLMGHSSGAAATHILALSEKTKRLFHRYILLGSSILHASNIHPRRRYRQVGLKLAKLAGCRLKKDDNIITPNETLIFDPTAEDVLYLGYKVKNDEEILKCMRTIDAKKLEAMTYYFSVWRSHPWCNFGPTLEDNSEDAIVTMHPMKMIKAGMFRDIPAIMQVTKDEGLVKTIELFTNPETEDELMKNFEEYLPYFMECHEVISNTSVFASAIEDFYFNGNVMLGLMHNITEMFSDFMTWPVIQALQYQSKLGNTSIYFSLFAYEGTFSHTFSSGIPVSYGVSHGDELNYLFPILNNKYKNMLLYNTGNDITMINIMTEMWASFVTNGIPKARLIPAWPNYRDHHQFMRFGIDRLPETVVQTDFLSNRMEFWEKLMINESAESTNDVFVSEPPENITGNANAIDHRLTVQLASLVIIFIYM
ncbi:PREDICTED: esterase E4-like [Cyphomyrmex costatus]|uniref:esterase E4-like n=1 Tax=Cyphomyrmex costatus TaxID=456900 RepID=UPI000852430D|nr:PREDICTED: esterase E4-like [Cyphomyrmex costatus]